MLQDQLDRNAIEQRMSKSCSLPSLVRGGSTKLGAGFGAKSDMLVNGCRVRVDCLPSDCEVEELEAHIRKLLRRRKAACPASVDVAVDPITQLPRGHCFLDFDNA